MASDLFKEIIPIRLSDGRRVTSSDMRYLYDSRGLQIYIFSKEDSNLHVAVSIEESDWYVALFRPFYKRVTIFESAEKIGPEMISGIFSRPSMRKLRKRMAKKIEISDQQHANVGEFVDTFRNYYYPQKYGKAQ